MFYRFSKRTVLFIIFAFSIIIHSDVVTLYGGKMYSGEITSKTDTYIVIKMPSGLVKKIDRKDIRKISIEKSLKQLFEEKCNRTDLNDIESLQKLANWTKRKKYLTREHRKLLIRITNLQRQKAQEIFTDKYKQLDKNNEEQFKEFVRWVKKQPLQQQYKTVLSEFNLMRYQKLREKAGSDTQKLYELFLWRKKYRLQKISNEEILSQILAIDPEHVMARLALNQKNIKGSGYLLMRLHNKRSEILMQRCEPKVLSFIKMNG